MLCNPNQSKLNQEVEAVRSLSLCFFILDLAFTPLPPHSPPPLLPQSPLSHLVVCAFYLPVMYFTLSPLNRLLIEVNFLFCFVLLANAFKTCACRNAEGCRLMWDDIKAGTCSAVMKKMITK